MGFGPVVSEKSLLVCLPSRVFGGHERMLIRILRGLLKEGGISITVVCALVPQLITELKKLQGIDVVVGYRREAGVWANRLLSPIATINAVRSAPPHSWVMFAPGVVQIQFAHIFMAKLLKRKVVVYVPMCFPAAVVGIRAAWFRDVVARLMIRAVDSWITITSAQKNLLRGHWGVERAIDVVPNVIDASDVAAPHRQPTCGRSQTQVVFIGRYEPFQKGLDWLCQALRETSASWIGRMRFAFYGEGEFKAQLEQLAADCGAENITVNGWATSAVALADADLLLLPSRFEGFPLVFLEASQAGVAVLSTRFEGSQELLGESGCVLFGNTQELLQSLLRMTNPSVRLQMLRVQAESLSRSANRTQFGAAVSELLRTLGLGS